MMQIQSLFAALACCVTAVCLGGCSATDGKIIVEGTVTLDGQPLEKAMVAFIGNQGGSISSGPTDSQGRFSIAAVAGPNKVIVNKLAPGDDGGFPMPVYDDDVDESTEGLTGADEGIGGMTDEVRAKRIIDPMFSDPVTTPFQVTVEQGMSELDLQVLSP